MGHFGKKLVKINGKPRKKGQTPSRSRLLSNYHNGTVATKLHLVKNHSNECHEQDHHHHSITEAELSTNGPDEFDLTRYTDGLFEFIIRQRTPVLILAVASFLVTSWIIFGGIYYGVAVYGFWRYDHTTNCGIDQNKTCGGMNGVNTWTDAFLFSLETATTIGYGGRYPKDDAKCVYLISTVNTLQYILYQITLGIVLLVTTLRFSRPKYTKMAKVCDRCCVYEENGEMKLSIRIINYMPSEADDKIVSAAVTAKLYKVPESESLSEKSSDSDDSQEFNNEEICLEFGNAFDGGILILTPAPLDLIHTIDEESPFYEVNPEKLEKMELVVCLSITMESTASVYQIRKSFLGCEEFAWGKRYQSCVRKHHNFSVKQFKRMWEVDFKRAETLEKVVNEEGSDDESGCTTVVQNGDVLLEIRFLDLDK